MTSDPTGNFLEALKSSRLLTPAQWESICNHCDHADDPRTIADRLVEDGWLTRWQAEHLLAGQRQLRLGHYRLLELLGRGGMSSVFKAAHPSWDVPIALKVLSPRYRDRQTAVALFLREARLASSLSHENLIAAHGVEAVDGARALVMEFVAGHDLRAWIAGSGRLPIPWACDCIRQAALAAQYIAERGIVHRDLKPGNILVRQEDGRLIVKILDLGVARIDGETADGGRLRQDCGVGTPGYVPPEQIRRCGEVDPRADIYSLGCTLFELLTGSVPFPGDSPEERLAAHLSGHVPRLADLDPRVPPDLDRLVAAMLAPDPDDRILTAAEVAAALAAIIAGSNAVPSPRVVLDDDTPGAEHELATPAAATLHLDPNAAVPASTTRLFYTRD